MKRFFGRHSNAEDRGFISLIYRGLLGRDPDEGGLQHFSGLLRKGELDRLGLIESVLASNEFKQRAASGIRPGSNGPFGCLESEARGLFDKFQKHRGPGRKGFVTNFLGGVTDVRFVKGIEGLSGVVENYPIPGNFHGDTLEWIGTLRSALEARGKFVMFELGAGWAPWCVIGYLAAKQCGIADIKVIGVEGDAGHIDFIRETFAANGIGPQVGRVIHSIAGVTDGEALFPIANDASRVYGGAAAFSDADRKAGVFAEFVATQSTLVGEVERLPCLSLATLMQEFDQVDLIHCDIQGSEAKVLNSSIEQISAKVKRIVIGTHSFEIERDLASLFPKHNWNLEGINACAMREDNGKPVLTHDGVQVWRNARLSSAQ
jgi:FkbM family methyltransferase